MFICPRDTYSPRFKKERKKKGGKEGKGKEGRQI